MEENVFQKIETTLNKLNSFLSPSGLAVTAIVLMFVVFIGNLLVIFLK